MIDWTRADRWHGLLMSGPMVRRALTGEKTETRRIGEKWKRAESGDGIWIRETCCPSYGPKELSSPNGCQYRADWGANDGIVPEPKWMPSIFMPKSLCRLAFILTDVRKERIGDITDAAIVREGVASLEAWELFEMGMKRRLLPGLEADWPAMRPDQKWRAGWESLHGAWDSEIMVTVLSWALKGEAL